MHKTVKLNPPTWELTPEQMDELIERVLGQFGKPVMLISANVYEFPNFRTGLRQTYLTVVAVPQGESK